MFFKSLRFFSSKDPSNRCRAQVNLTQAYTQIVGVSKTLIGRDGATQDGRFSSAPILHTQPGSITGRVNYLVATKTPRVSNIDGGKTIMAPVSATHAYWTPYVGPKRDE